jgi:hypothetical protein
LSHWAELREPIELGLGWRPPQKLMAVRLMGAQPMSVLSEPEVTEVFLACHVLAPQYQYAFQELRCEIDEDRFKRCKAALGRQNLESITPADATAAQAVLLGLIDKATERLRMLEAKRRQVADILDGLQADILGYDETKGGEGIRRHQGACNRLLLRNVEAVHKNRRNEAEGWGRTRQEREQRKEERGRSASPGGIVANRCDLRLVLDDQGKVRSAYGYAGNLEEGLARYEAEFGPQLVGTADTRREINENEMPRVPDYAIWIKEERLREERLKAEARRRNQGIEAEAGLADGAERVEQDAVAAMGLTAQGDRAKNQNEIVDLSWAIEKGADETCGRADDGVRDPRRAEDQVIEAEAGSA